MVKRGIFALLLITMLLVQGVVSAAGHITQHHVRYGETLSMIAHHYGVTTDRLARHNGIINPNLIHVGQVLVIPEPVTAYPPAPQPPVGHVNHTVSYGESVTLIARYYGSDPHRIIHHNGIMYPYWVYPGQHLVIPVNW